MKQARTTGKITVLLAQNGSGWGPPSDFIDADVVIQLDNQPSAGFGFQLRNDIHLPYNNAMFALLRDAYRNNQVVEIDYSYAPLAQNGILFRVVLSKL